MLVEGFAFGTAECDIQASWACNSPMQKIVDGVEALNGGDGNWVQDTVGFFGGLGGLGIGFLQMMILDYAFLTDGGGFWLGTFAWVMRFFTIGPMAGILIISLIRRYVG